MKSNLSKTKKPEAQRLGWEVTKSRVVYEDKRFKVREDCLQVPRKEQPVTFAYAERKRAVIIIPVSPKGDIFLIRQYRYPIDAWCLETPAGSTQDAGGMPLEDVVRKELHEELGATAGEVEWVGRFFTVPAYSAEVCEVYVAWDVELSSRPEPEPTEVISTRQVTAPEAIRIARSGEMENGVSAHALSLCEGLLQRRGYL